MTVRMYYVKFRAKEDSVMKKIYALVLSIFLFGCWHSTTSEKLISNRSVLVPEKEVVRIGGFVFTKPANWKMEDEYKCGDATHNQDTTNVRGLPCSARVMYSSSGKLRIRIEVIQTNIELSPAYSFCVHNTRKDCFVDKDRVVFSGGFDGNLFFMIFPSHPHAEITVSMRFLSEISRREEKLFASFFNSIQPQ